jgi:pyruvate-formate lyase-activating enzyme
MPYVAHPREYYRFPWSLTDNGISWLEVTANCNLDCKGCYRDRHSTGHKSLREIADDLAVFARERKSDCMSIAGGDPLVHPDIVEIVRMVRNGGWKPILNTNGLALTPALLKALKTAGVFGFTFHIDTSQNRRDGPAAAREADHNDLRMRFAEMLAREGGIACSFNQTVTLETLEELPEVIRWAQKYPDLINTMVFILYREPGMLGAFDYYAGATRVDFGSIYEDGTGWGDCRTLRSQDVVDRLIEVDPTYRPSAYLNGTCDPESMKWLVGLRVATGERTFGWVTPTFMEWVQTLSHMFRGKWLSYAGPSTLSAGRIASFAFGAFDPGMRRIAWSWLKSAAASPSLLFRRAHLQAFMIIQPIDFLADGRMNMCDACPDMTVHDGRLYWSCRLEEVKKYGSFLTAVPKAPAARL